MIKEIMQKRPWKNPIGRSVAYLQNSRLHKKQDFTQDFKSAWTPTVTMDEWETFLSTEPNDESRDYSYEYIRTLCSDGRKREFAEVGFGQCRDFYSCFKALVDDGSIAYHGYDVTEQFINYAKQKFTTYDFRYGGFLNMDQCDISYTRHTFEHQNPNEFQTCLEGLLSKTREECIIVWFIPPSRNEDLKWVPAIGISTEAGAYLNRYGVDTVDPLIDSAGFDLKKVRVAGNVVYHCTRRPAVQQVR